MPFFSSFLVASARPPPTSVGSLKTAPEEGLYQLLRVEWKLRFLVVQRRGPSHRHGHKIVHQPGRVTDRRATPDKHSPESHLQGPRRSDGFASGLFLFRLSSVVWFVFFLSGRRVCVFLCVEELVCSGCQESRKTTSSYSTEGPLEAIAPNE